MCCWAAGAYKAEHAVFWYVQPKVRLRAYEHTSCLVLTCNFRSKQFVFVSECQSQIQFRNALV